MQEVEGRLSRGEVATGFITAGALVLFLAVAKAVGSWALMHNQPLLFAGGSLVMLFAPIWLLKAAISAVKNKQHPWQFSDVAAMVSVCVALLLVG